MNNPEELQHSYYEKTAKQYDAMHVHQEDEHFRALDHIQQMARQCDIKTFLDVGCGTGRGVEFLLKNGFIATGIDPSQDLLNQGIRRNPDLANHLYKGSGFSLPYENQSFDAACVLGVLHHVRDPQRIIREMMRVTSKAIFISDSNRFGQGTKCARWTKFLLWRLKLWPLANYIKTKGKGYILTEGDGLSYSYSVYDSYKLLKNWAVKIVEISTDEPRNKNNPQPLILKSTHILLAVLRIS